MPRRGDDEASSSRHQPTVPIQKLYGASHDMHAREILWESGTARPISPRPAGAELQGHAPPAHRDLIRSPGSVPTSRGGVHRHKRGSALLRGVTDIWGSKLVSSSALSAGVSQDKAPANGDDEAKPTRHESGLAVGCHTHRFDSGVGTIVERVLSADEAGLWASGSGGGGEAEALIQRPRLCEPIEP